MYDVLAVGLLHAHVIGELTRPSCAVFAETNPMGCASSSDLSHT